MKAVRAADSYEDFLELIRAKGYEIKGETFAESDLNILPSALLTENVLSVAASNLWG